MSEETDDLEKLLDGDGFVKEEDKAEQQARERRLARKRRLQDVSEDLDEPREQKVTAPEPTVEPVKPDNTSEQEMAKQEVMATLGMNPTYTAVQEADGDDDSDGFDMFSSSVSPMSTKATTVKTVGEKTKNVDQHQDWDDTEGYYKATIGEIMQLQVPQSSTDLQFRIGGVIGKGVFSTVLKCTTESSDLSSPSLPPQVALKVIRHNETMAKAAINEIRFLQRLTKADSPGIIKLLLPSDSVPIDYRGHTILIFPFMEFNLRDVLAKFGKGVGLSLTGVRSYFAQMLAACWQLKQHNIIHSDLKPDNILVSSDFSKICLADFGSAVDSTEGVEVAPYLVSRFYRAPEIILGLQPTFAIDLWSLAVTAAELFLGKILFNGGSNNDMIHVMMNYLGPCSNKLIRQHVVQTKRFPIPSHFSAHVPYLFQKLVEDPISGQQVCKNMPVQDYKATLQTKLLKAKSATDSRHMVIQFADLLQKCLTMDPLKRIDYKAALQHEFFKDKKAS